MGVPGKHKSWSCAAQALLFGVEELQQNRVEVSTAVSGLCFPEGVGLDPCTAGGEGRHVPPGILGLTHSPRQQVTSLYSDLGPE